ncbi:MAG: serine/threonine protein kinase [Myxococcales bacterium]|nr:serine/threonine protein kinase [Myxococcales bacterium]
MTTPPAALEPGAVVGGRYAIRSLIAEGGMGAVWEAVQAHTNRVVAVKVLHARWANNDVTVQRFIQEARIVAELDHPNIAQIIDGGTDRRYGVYSVFERLYGGSLYEWIVEHERLDLLQIERWIVPVMHGLTAAHERGVVHRDVKPENIYLALQADGSMHSKLLDFGISKVGSSTALVRTRTGTLVGTPSYMSPEQTMGDRALDHRADQWSVAVVLYECLAGRLPFEGGSLPEVVAGVLHGTPTPLAQVDGSVPSALAGAVMRALAKNPADRFASMRSFASEVHDACRVARTTLAHAETQSQPRDAAPLAAVIATPRRPRP